MTPSSHSSFMTAERMVLSFILKSTRLLRNCGHMCTFITVTKSTEAQSEIRSDCTYGYKLCNEHLFTSKLIFVSYQSSNYAIQTTLISQGVKTRTWQSTELSPYTSFAQFKRLLGIPRLCSKYGKQFHVKHLGEKLERRMLFYKPQAAIMISNHAKAQIQQRLRLAICFS